MSGVETVDAALRGGDDVVVATLVFYVLPKTSASPPPLLNLQGDSAEEGEEAIQFLEGTEYRYELETELTSIRLEPTELFEPDDETGVRGRFRPGLSTGHVQFQLSGLEGSPSGRAGAEVRSRKLDYLSQYRWMLRDIADEMSELVMERFAASEQTFAPDEGREANTLYERFAFLQALLLSPEFEGAIRQVLSRPHVSWTEEVESRRPEQGIRATGSIASQIAAVGARTRWSGGTIESLPARFRVVRPASSLDNGPNRFVKFALTRWRDLAEQVREALLVSAATAPVRRGMRECEAVADKLTAYLSEQLFREVGDLVHFPANNQVLHKSEGYRDIFRVYFQAEVAAKLAWPGGEDVYSAGQRNVAALYEYWTYLQLADVVDRLCGGSSDKDSLVEVSRDGLSVTLTRRHALRVTGRVERLGRPLLLELWFNRTFSSTGARPEAWSRPMRPDAALKISSELPDDLFEPTWLHFDAKYRIQDLQDLMGIAPVDSKEEDAFLKESSEADNAGMPKRSDLLKMHAYRDAIKRSSGAYVLYPGDKQEMRRPYDEILPGLGAFVLRPTENGGADGSDALSEFLDRVIDHFASQLTAHERERYWTREIHIAKAPAPRALVAPFLRKPAADTLMLLGYVRTPEQLAWIHQLGLYNLRADEGRHGAISVDSVALSAGFVVLYGPSVGEPQIWRVNGRPQVLTKGELVESGYGRPGGEKYLCLPIERIELDYKLSAELVNAAKQTKGGFPGQPVAITWCELVAGVV